MVNSYCSIVVPLFAALFTLRTTPVHGNARLGNPKKLETDRTRFLQDGPAKLTYVGDEGVPAGAFPLGRCEGDCDSDDDCEGNLKCFQRGPNDTADVPGCTGSPVSGRDYCYEEPDGDQGGFTGNAGVDQEIQLFRGYTFPLTRCQGDCDHNGQCEGNLECFQRGNTESVPGCAGDGEVGMDYCYDPNQFTGSSPTTPVPTSPSSSGTPVPTPKPTPVPTTNTPPSNYDSEPHPLLLLGNNLPYLLGNCEGDCDSDADCDGLLKCFQRGASVTEVPGCEGDPVGNWDYCYMDPNDAGDELQTPPPTTAPATPPPTPSPTTPIPTALPTPSPTSLPQLDSVGQNLPPSAFPLANCQGDCDADSDCEGSLICWQRNPSNRSPIPGCAGIPPDNYFDFCYDPTTVPTPAPTKAPSPSPTESTPEPSPPPTAVTPSPTVATPPPTVVTPPPTIATPPPTPLPTPPPSPVPTPLPTLLPTNSPTAPPTQLPLPDKLPLEYVGETNDLGNCQGDCDSDSDCRGNLVCFQRGKDDTDPIPGCTGTLISGRDYCYDPNAENDEFGGSSSTNTPSTSPIESPTKSPSKTPTKSPTESPTAVPTVPANALVLIGDNGSPASAFPLSECEGDCDSHNDCEGSLLCFHRTDTTPVPGCTGSGVSNKDYCYNPNPSTPPPTPEDDGFGGSSSTNIPTSAPTPSPTESPTPPPTPAPTPPLTPAPTPPANSLVFAGQNGSPSSAFPLSKCEGDCDNDNDCEGSLQCFQRSDATPVPGCTGPGESGRDYCFDPADEDGADSPPDDFKLKLFWRIGYMWQESANEEKYCMDCEDNSCRRDKIMIIDRCERVDTKFQFFNPGGNGTQIQLVGTDLCLTRYNVRALRTDLCNSTTPRQRWHPGLGTFNDSRFELSPINKQGCVSQHHHPKPDEVLYVETCAKAHRAETGYWNKYDD